MPARSVIAGMLGVAFAIAILAASGLLMGGGSVPGHSPAVQSQQGANAPLYAVTSPSASSSNPGAVYEMSQSSPSPQAISNLTASSVGSLMLLGAASLAISFGLALFLSRRLK